MTWHSFAWLLGDGTVLLILVGLLASHTIDTRRADRAGKTDRPPPP